ncbi:hypothetical protein [Streptomyces sp. FL07-04A]|uniref:hypothetical protein n=1 Tax=Streptomyces sp. FL07-04A TaxID=3028658 RepID=UPI0029AB2745|nr:hypothetical protein [Streptomyces sp. FL07-04A]MDX3579998.1 hypothetical protein [Streptomyces sp. FL07-04A]
MSTRSGTRSGTRTIAGPSPSAGGVPFTGESGPRARRGTTERPRDVRPAPEGELEGNEK